MKKNFLTQKGYTVYNYRFEVWNIYTKYWIFFKYVFFFIQFYEQRGNRSILSDCFFHMK